MILIILKTSVISPTKQAKFEYFSSYNCVDSKPFWVNCKSYFSNKCSQADTDIVLNENGDLILKNEEIAKTFNDYFGSIVQNLDLTHCEGTTTSPSNTPDKINKNIKTKYRGITVGGGMPTKILKECELNFSVLARCVNKCIETGFFPDMLKLANATCF